MNWPMTFFKSIADRSLSRSPSSPGQLALREMKRNESRSDLFFQHPAELSDLLVRTLRNRQSKALDSLLTSTHFSVGFGAGHFHFENNALRSKILDELLNGYGEISHSLSGNEGRMQLFMKGWDTELLKDDVGFILTKNTFRLAVDRHHYYKHH